MTNQPQEIENTTLEKLLFEHTEGVETRLRMLVACLRDGDEANKKLPKDVYVQLIYRIIQPKITTAQNKAVIRELEKMPDFSVLAHGYADTYKTARINQLKKET